MSGKRDRATSNAVQKHHTWEYILNHRTFQFQNKTLIMSTANNEVAHLKGSISKPYSTGSSGVIGMPVGPETQELGRKLRPLVITMGGERQEKIIKMFEALSSHFEPPAFSPGVPQRKLRNRMGLISTAYEAGLIPQKEWEAFLQSKGEIPTNAYYNDDNDFHKDSPPSDQRLLCKAWQAVPLTPSEVQRKGSTWDVQQHYTAEFWRKAKGLARDRAVLACTLAHLIAMKIYVQGGYDFILEDNVRAPIDAGDCAARIREVKKKNTGADLIYLGWLGSIPNLTWVIHTHAKRFSTEIGDGAFPFPVAEHHYDEGMGGTALWGAYAYHISQKGYDALVHKTLKHDVGSMLWKGKRMRSYISKPIDKILPRALIRHNLSVIVAQRPSFFRAPMLSSKIHTKWDPEFCKSTEYQLTQCSLNWNDLFLTETERLIVEHRLTSGSWKTERELFELYPMFFHDTKVISDVNI